MVYPVVHSTSRPPQNQPAAGQKEEAAKGSWLLVPFNGHEPNHTWQASQGDKAGAGALLRVQLASNPSPAPRLTSELLRSPEEAGSRSINATALHLRQQALEHREKRP